MSGVKCNAHMFGEPAHVFLRDGHPRLVFREWVYYWHPERRWVAMREAHEADRKYEGVPAEQAQAYCDQHVKNTGLQAVVRDGKICLLLEKK